MKLLSSLIAVQIFTFAPVCLGAEETTPSSRAKDQKTNVETMAVKTAASPILESQTGFAGSGFMLEAGGDATTAILALSNTWTNRGSWTHALTFKASTPIDRKSKEGTLVTDLGVTKGTTLEVSYNLVVLPPVDDSPAALAQEEAALKRYDELYERHIERAVKECGPAPTTVSTEDTRFIEGDTEEEK